MTHKEMLEGFAEAGVPEYAFFLGPVAQAEMVNGMHFEQDHWMVYYRERGELSNVKVFKVEEEACDELYRRVMRSMNQ